MLLHAINQAAHVKSTDNSGNSCNIRASIFRKSWFLPKIKTGIIKSLDLEMIDAVPTP
jgi:hypothetical protein